MGDRQGRSPVRTLGLLLAVAAAAAIAAAAYIRWGTDAGAVLSGSDADRAALLVQPSQTSAAEIRSFCTRCHAYPPADTFPRSAWNFEVNQAYKFLATSNLYVKPPPIDDVI
jgi:hypothetical protein